MPPTASPSRDVCATARTRRTAIPAAPRVRQARQSIRLADLMHLMSYGLDLLLEGRPSGLIYWRIILPEEPIAPLKTHVLPFAKIARG